MRLMVGENQAWEEKLLVRIGVPSVTFASLGIRSPDFQLAVIAVLADVQVVDFAFE